MSMPTQDERNAATRSALIESAQYLFAERGYADLPVASIASRAGVTTGALYHQFGSKEELFKVVYARLVEGVAAQVMRAREHIDEPTLLVDCEAFVAACADPAFKRITIDGPAVIGWDRILDQAEAMVHASLSAAEARGELTVTPSAPLARMLAAALKEAAVIIATADSPDQARRTATESLQKLIGGLLVPHAVSS